jgi:6-phosphogluconolactonase
MSHIEILPDERTLATQAATRFARLAAASIHEHKRFMVALSGGSTPKGMYALLAKTPFIGQVDWTKVHLFWGDERCVPPDHSESNYRMANEALLSRVPLPSENVYRIPGELAPHVAAEIYTEELRRAFGESLPHFDLILLGLGSDGHTASLFPGSPLILHAPGPVSAVTEGNIHPPQVSRVTLTPQVLNAARQVIFLVRGQEKASILAEVLQGPFQPEKYPAQIIQPTEGELTWLLDDPAASKITRYS